jgi:DNA-directed RNA polymerase specialized sigma24 family protein
MTPAERIAGTASARQSALDLVAEHTDRLRKAVVAAVKDGMSESEAARLAGVTRMTVRSWLGK